jgi:hypothetical protein
MSVAVLLIFITVAHQGHMLRPTKRLQQTKREFLPVILNDTIARIDASTLAKFFSIAAAELAPSNEALLEAFQKHFARRKIWHPDVAAAHRKIPSANARRQYAQPVTLTIYRRINGFRFDHRSFSSITDQGIHFLITAQ